MAIWAKTRNLPHLWHYIVFQGIGDTLSRYLIIDASCEWLGVYTYGRFFFVDIDISKGLSNQINLKINDFHWTPALDL